MKRFTTLLTLLVLITSNSIGQQNLQDSIQFTVSEERLKIRSNEDRKACDKALHECGVQNNILEQRVDNSNTKVANLIAAEQKYKDNQIAYKVSVNAGEQRIKELTKKNKGLKLKLRLTVLAAAGVLVKVILF
jgi:hypothetical protein